MLVDPAPTCPKGTAFQSLNWSASHGTGFVSPPYNSVPDISNNTISFNSSRQNQGYSNALDLAPANDFDMLVNPDITGINPQTRAELASTTVDSFFEIEHECWNSGGSELAQRAWEATNFAHVNGYDMLVDLPPSFHTGRLNRYYRRWWTAQPTYP